MGAAITCRREQKLRAAEGRSQRGSSQSCVRCRGISARKLRRNTHHPAQFGALLRRPAIPPLHRYASLASLKYPDLQSTLRTSDAFTPQDVCANLKDDAAATARMGAGIYSCATGSFPVSYTHLTLPTTPYV